MPRARKPTKAELGRLRLTTDWSDEELNDPEVLAIRRQLEQEEAQAEARKNADFSGVTGSFRGPPTPPPQEEEPQSYADRGWGRSFDSMETFSQGMRDALAGGAQRSLAGLLTLSADPNSLPESFGGDIVRWEDAMLQEYAPGAYSDLVNTRKRILDQRAGLLERSKANQAAAEASRAGIRTEVGRQAAEAFQDFAGSPVSALSVVGGPMSAGITGLDVYGQEYMAAEMAGVDPETARTRAGLMASLEGGVSAIPAGQFLSRIPGVRRFAGRAGGELLKSDAAKTAIKTTRAIFGEAAEEGVTEAAQIGVDAALNRISEDDRTDAFTASNTVDFWNQVWRATKAGAVGGGAIGSVHSQFEIAAEAGRLASQAQQSNDNQRRGLRDRVAAERAQEAEAARIADEKAAAFKARENEIAVDPQRQADEIEAAYRTQERQNQADRIARGASLDQQPNVMTDAFQRVQVQPVTAEEVAAERQAAQQAANKKQKDADALVNRVQTMRQKAKDAETQALIDKDTETVTKKATSMRNAARRKAVQGIMDDTRNMTPEERKVAVQQRVDEWDAANPMENFTAQATAKPVKKTQVGQTRKPVVKPVAKPVTEETQAAEDEAGPPPARDFNQIKKELGLGSTAQRIVTKLKNGVNATLTQRVVKDFGNGEVEYQILATDPKGKRLGSMSYSTKGGKPTVGVREDTRRNGLATAMYDMARQNGADLSSTENRTADGTAFRNAYDKGNLGSAATATEGVTAQEALDTLKKNVSSGDAKKVLKLIGDGNAVVINDESEVPKGSAPSGSGAYYDGDKTYIIASKLDKNNVMGDLLKFAAHEVKHAADVSGNKKLKATMGGFIGKKANDQIVTKIEKLAANGNKLAQDVVAAAKKGSTPDTYSLELPAYWMNAMNERRESTGQPRRIAEDIVSAVRTQYKKMKGDADINLKDVSYMGRKLLEEAGLSGERLTGDINAPLATIAGRTAKGFQAAKDSGLTYTGPDGKERFIFSDQNAELVPGNRWKANMLGKQQVKITDVLKHDILYNQYPEAKDIDFAIDERLLPNQHGYMDTDGKTIYMHKKFLDQTEKYDSFIMDLLTHELQHYVQDVEGHARGGNAAMFFTRQDDIIYDGYDRMATKLDGFEDFLRNPGSIERAFKDQPEAQRMMKLLRESYNKNQITRMEFLSMGADYLYEAPNMTPSQRVLGKSMEMALESYRTLGVQIDEISARQHDQYERLYGEMEARFTAENRGMAQEDLPVNPEEQETGRPGAFDRDPEKAIIALGGRTVDEPWEARTRQGELIVGGNEQQQPSESSEKPETPAQRLRREMAESIDRMNDLSTVWKAADKADTQLHKMIREDNQKGWFRDNNIRRPSLIDAGLMMNGVDEHAGEAEANLQIAIDAMPNGKRKAQYQELFDEMLRIKAAKQAETYYEPRSGQTPTALGSAVSRFQQPSNRATKVLDNAIKTIGGSLKTFGNLGHDLGVMKENADGEAALHAHRAMNYFNWLNRGVTKIAKAGVSSGKYANRAEGEAAIKEEIRQKMQDIAALPDETRREAALAAYVRQRPELDGLMAAVQEVRQLSRELLKQMVQSNSNPTNAELKLMNTIMDNSFRYTTQMYAAFQGEAGRIHSQRIIDEYDRAVRLLKKGKAIPEKIKDSFNTYKNAMKYLIDNDLTIPEGDELESSSTDKLKMLYDTWVGDASRAAITAKEQALADGMTVAQANQFARDTLIAGLEAKAPSIKETDFEGKARDLILGMLELSNEGGPFASYYRGFKQDRSILEQRTGLPEEIKKLFGEITDPATRLAVTIAKQGELAARTRMLLDMRDNGQGKWVVPPEAAGLPGNEEFTATLQGQNFGPLNGWRTKPEIASAISDNLEMFTNLTDAMAQSYQNAQPLIEAIGRAGLKGLKGAAAFQKISSVVFDLYNMGTNFVGSWIALVANGVWNPLRWKSGRVALEALVDSVYTKTGELSPEFEDAIKYGILDSARVQEIRKTPQKFVKELISVKPKSYRTAATAVGKVRSGTVEAFALSDAWVKIVAFQDRVRDLTRFYEAEGIDKSKEAIKKEAADQIKDTNITYARTPAAVRGAEAIGLTTFMPYFVSVPRALLHNLALGIQDTVRATNAKTAKGKVLMMQNGIQRITGAYTASVGVAMLTKALAAGFNDDDDDKVAEMKKMMYEDARFSDSFYLGKDAANNGMFARFSRLDPFGPANDLLRISLDDSISPEEKRRHMVEMLKDMIITNRVVVAGTTAAADIFGDADIQNKKMKIERIAPKAMENIKEWMGKIPGLDYSDTESIVQFIDSFTPGFADVFDSRNRGVDQPKGPWEGLMGDIISYSGGRLDSANPSTAAYRVGKAVEDARNEGRSRLAQGVAAGRDPEALAQIFLESAAKEQTAMQEARRAYEGMVNGAGLTPRQAGEILKEEGSLTQSDIANIRSGRVNQELEEWLNNGTRMLSKSSLKQRSEEGLPPEEKKQQAEQRKAFIEAMKALGYKVREN